MTSFLSEDFLLDTETARYLYHEHAAGQGIIDYHCHLPPREIADNRRFSNLAQIWLEGDHYKWRGMRAAGIDEHYITGKASDLEKFNAWAEAVPKTLGNPLYIWTHLELKRPFNISGLLLSPDTAEYVWTRTSDLLSTDEYSAQGIMQQMNVRMVGTTDDPVDDLAHHQKLAESDFPVRVLPSFRPDRSFKIELPGFTDYLKQLEAASDMEITTIFDIYAALKQRMDHFEALGCCSADHGIEILRFANVPDERTLNNIVTKALNDQTLTVLEVAQYTTAIQVWLGREYSRRGWVMQLHIGAQRDNNERMLNALGPNTGFDSIGDRPIAEALARLLSEMDQDDRLPKTILYGINPSANEVLATMAGNFQDGSVPGKVQYGSAWWFNDQHDGMLRQLTQVAQHGLISQFVGMLTDSRSFLSYTRHEYFRRILCAMLGRLVQSGELPDEKTLLGPMVEDICFNNANRYFNLNLDSECTSENNRP